MVATHRGARMTYSDEHRFLGVRAVVLREEVFGKEPLTCLRARVHERQEATNQ